MRVGLVVARLCAALVVVGGLTVGGVTAQADTDPEPPSPCSDQAKALSDVHGQIDAHNAKPHLFIVPDQQAQSDAYNAEAKSLESAQAKAKSDLNACVDEVNKLLDQTKSRPPTNNDISKIQNGKDALPQGYSPPQPRFVAGFIAVDEPERPLLDALQSTTPGGSDVGDEPLQHEQKPAAGMSDPAFNAARGLSIPSGADGQADVKPNRVVPVAELLTMPGFTKLPPTLMYEIANAPLNLQWLTDTQAMSLVSESVANAAGVDPSWLSTLHDRRKQIKTQLEETVTKLLATLGITP